MRGKLRAVTYEDLKQSLHYDPETGIFTRLLDGAVAGCIKKSRPPVYIQICVKGVRVLAHRMAWLYMTGEMPTHSIDHKDGNPINNKWSNLREATPSQNGMNRDRQRNNKTGVKGVHYRTDYHKYRAAIRAHGKRYNLGSFKTLAEAKEAYRRAAETLHGEYARTQ